MEKNNLPKKGLAVGIIALFICAGFVPNLLGIKITNSNQNTSEIVNGYELQKYALVTCYTFGFPSEPSQEVAMPLDEAEFLYNKLKNLQTEIARDPLSDRTQQLQHEIVALADEHNLLPTELSPYALKSRFNPSVTLYNHLSDNLPLPSKGSELFCTFVSTGSGSSLPIIVLPRFIPILLTPIPRVFIWWNAQEAITSCGGLLSGTGFIAYGQQKGLALGFWGIGFTFSLPPFMNTYGLAGYALFTKVNAEEIEFYPPNRAPVISNENPSNWAYDVSTSLSKLSFRIEDADGDRMDYTVTTEPDIGSDSGKNKKNGIYSVSVSGLEPDKLYIWTVEVDDGKDKVKKDFTFFTGEPSYDIVFQDDFDDNSKDYNKWTEIYTDGTWEEKNRRVEFKVYEPGPGRSDEGIESSEFSVSLSSSEPLVVSCDMITDIGSTNWVGRIRLEVTDGTNWIWIMYHRNRDILACRDSNDEKFTVFKSNKPDGSWDNELFICIDKYYVRMDSENSGWIYDSVFSSDATLKVRIYLQNSGSSPSLYMHSGFDNIMVKSPR